MERAATFRTADDVARVQQLASAGNKITRFLRVHSAIGAEVQHVQNLLKLVATLDREQQEEVCLMAYEVGVTLSQWFNSREWSDLNRLLDEWSWEPFVGTAQLSR